MTAIATTSGGRFWLQGRLFDLSFILLIPAIAISAAALMAYDTQRFLIIATLNTVLLAQPHLVATYTRTSFDRSTFKKHFALMVPLPAIIILTVALMAHSAGGWLVATIYFYWQWWHYARQSYGISRMYLTRAQAYRPHRLIDGYALYALPLAGILYRSYQQPASFLGMPLYTFPIPLAAVQLAALAGAALLAAQGMHWYRGLRRGTLPAPYVLYVFSHYTIFAAGYFLIEDINIGWLALSIWHNTQYIAFVWLYNHKRFQAGRDEREPFLSDISRFRMLPLFLFICVFIATALNFGLAMIAAGAASYSLLPWLLILSMSVNFHHYILDAIVWKRKRREVYA